MPETTCARDPRQGLIVRLLGLVLAFLLAPSSLQAASHHRHAVAAAPPPNPSFKVGGLVFTVPAGWMAESPRTPVRAGQWRIPPPKGTSGEGAELVAFFFGVGKGGTIRDNLDGWVARMTMADGQPATATPMDHLTSGLKISRLVVNGIYAQPVPAPGVPPQPRSDFELAGAAIKNPGGNIYWRLVGPDALVTANLPLFDQLLDSVKPDQP